MATILDHALHIACLGYGVVGRAVARAFAARGVRVTVLEPTPEAVERAVHDGLQNTALQTTLQARLVSADMSDLTDLDAILISVGTPAAPNGRGLDMTQLQSTLPTVQRLLLASPTAVVAVRSTVPPGTTQRYRERLRNLLGAPEAASGADESGSIRSAGGAGINPRVFYVPEYLRAVSAAQDAISPRHIVIGCDEGDDPEPMLRLWRVLAPEPGAVSLMSVLEAELAKLLHNNYNAAKISFFNYAHLLVAAASGGTANMATIAASMVKTCEGLYNPAYGTRFTGTAYSGACLPKDAALTAALEADLGLPVRFMGMVEDVNKCMEDPGAPELKQANFMSCSSSASIDTNVSNGALE